MTKDEAEARVRVCRERVIEAVRRRHARAQGRENQVFSEGWHDAAIYAAGTDLAAAESALAALDKPRLMTASEVWLEAKGAGHPEGWRAVSRKTRAVVLSDILAQAEKLPRYMASVASYHEYAPGMVSGGLGQEPAILLSDLRKLLEGK
jgi:hypothetical protein